MNSSPPRETGAGFLLIGGNLSDLLQSTHCLARILPTIQHPVNDRQFGGFDLILNGIGETFRQHPVKAKNLAVNSRVKRQ